MKNSHHSLHFRCRNSTFSLPALFSSGIFCTDSPLLDDLFGFSVDDVLDEVKRGSRLLCYHCKKKGATAGCENKRCKKSFHYPCAVQGGAEIFEDHQHGKFGLYCLKHRKQSNGDYARAFQRHQFSNNSSEAGPSKAHCPACEKTEGKAPMGSLPMFYCAKHVPSSHKRSSNGYSSAARASSKRGLSFDGREEEENSFKRKSVNWNRIVSDDSSDSDKELIPPLESDIEESQNLATEPTVPQLNSISSERRLSSAAGNPGVCHVQDENKDEEETFIHSDAESESLLPPVGGAAPGPPPPAAPAQLPRVVSVEIQTLKRECDSESQPCLLRDSPETPVLESQSAATPEQSSCPEPGPPGPRPEPGPPGPRPEPGPPGPRPEPGPAPRLGWAGSQSVCAPPPPANAAPGVDSAAFWRSCNAAGCTQALFTHLVEGLKDVCSRIHTHQASQEDFDWALSVMEASGKLGEFVSRQQEELQRKQMELLTAAAAMKEVVSALKK
ncbi:uncharacterized protein phf11 isoform 2-T2 [Menidia menidia]